MAFHAIERLEVIIEFVVAFLDFLFKQINVVDLLVRDFNHVKVLKTIVVAVDVVSVRTLANVQHAHVLTIDVEHGGVASLPVQVYMTAHGALDDEVAEVQIAEVVTAIA